MNSPSPVLCHSLSAWQHQQSRIAKALKRSTPAAPRCDKRAANQLILIKYSAPILH